MAGGNQLHGCAQCDRHPVHVHDYDHDFHGHEYGREYLKR